MSLSQLLTVASTSPALARVTSHLQAGERPLCVSGLAGSALPLMIALVHRVQDRPTLAVVESPEAAEQLRDDLISLLGEPAVALFPDWEVQPYDPQSPDSEVVGLRLQALDRLRRGHPGIVVAPVRALTQKTIPPATLAAVSLHLGVGITLDLSGLLEQFARLGFERADTVQIPGFFSVRGGIVDLFPFGAEHPFRLELFGDEVESIRTFDIYTQRSTGTADQISILPNREVVIDPTVIQDATLRALIAADRTGGDGAALGERILTGRLFDGIEGYLPFYHPDAVSAAAYLPSDALVCLCEPDRLREQADEYARDIEEAYTQAIQAGEVVPAPAEGFESFDGLLNCLMGHQVAYLSRTDGGLQTSSLDCGMNNPKSKIQNPKFSDSNVFSIGATPTGVFHAALDVLRQRLAAWRGQHASVVVVCDNPGQVDRLTDLLGPEGDGLDMVIGNLHAGFIIPDLPLVVLTDAEILSRYRRRRHRRPFKEGIVIEDFTSLTEGDYVVHIDHGIGRYRGIQRLVVDDRERDCLTLGYAGDDRLYIPIEQLHRVQKYIGADGEVPALSRLGGKSWEQIKARTKKAVQDIAQELIALYAARQAKPGFAFSPDTPWQRALEDSFIYDETPDQLKATDEIKQDMERAAPMDRLVCGDVGYGKTEVAIRAAFKAVMDGKQVAVLVPTTILAQQHLTTFSDRLADYPITLQMLSRFKTSKEQKRILEGLKSGDVDIVIGTHRLIQRDIAFKNLGLLIIDEEQRFGVAHKERLKHLKQTVDVLVLTATPIPRTLHMSLVGARDMSIMNTPPKDRLPVQTDIMRFDEEVIREVILREVDRGGQVYFVHNRVQSIDAMAQFLQRLLPQVSFVVGHGQMPERELERVMVEFLDRKYDCLVSTMIIESGLDIPSVNTILVNRADRFGLAQLYQLRGRVGRSNQRAYAYLLIPTPGRITPDARKRLTVIAEYTALGSGFHIAMRDLEIRGAGNLLGAEQHGFMADVGFDLYCRLLQQAISELKGETPEEGTEPTVDLRVGAFIPDEYIPDQKQKVAFYQRLGRVSAEDQIETIREELRDRFGRLPDPTRALLDLVSIKLLAKTARLRSVTVRDRHLFLAYPEQQYPTKAQIADLVEDRGLVIEFPHGKTFQIKVRLAGTTDADRVECAKKLLQKLVRGVI